MVLARRSEARIGRGTEYGIAGVQNNQVFVATGPPLIEGNPISLYFYLGEGCWRAWISGRPVPVCNIDYEGPRQEEWWVEIKRSDDSLAWVLSGYDGFGFENQFELNSKLGSVIADSTLALSEKLEQVDLLIKAEADLNGDGGQYGTTPIETAVRSKDVALR